jgi:hypothetical protein
MKRSRGHVVFLSALLFTLLLPGCTGGGHGGGGGEEPLLVGPSQSNCLPRQFRRPKLWFRVRRTLGRR